MLPAHEVGTKSTRLKSEYIVGAASSAKRIRTAIFYWIAPSPPFSPVTSYLPNLDTFVMDLPVEIMDEILIKCSNDTLANVARVNVTFHALSERLLYSDIRLHTAGDTQMITLRSCLRSLFESTRRAAYVKNFDLYILGALKEADMNHLLAVLVSMGNLKHLSLDIECFHASTLARSIATALRKAKFSLTSLRIPSSVKCDVWMTSQRDLKTVVIFYDNDIWELDTPEWSLLQARTSSSRSPGKNIFLIKSRRGWPSDLIALPSLTGSGDDCSAKDPTRFFAYSQFISVFYLFMNGLSDSQTYIDICTQVSWSFSEIQTLVVVVEDGELDQITDSIGTIISLFSKLTYLRIRWWEGLCQKTSISATQEHDLADRWISQSKTLQSVIFPDMTIVYRRCG
ncbi:hypothetical protein GYMLUDRAFT_75157 [Collybiopsis luxurians FD-317 M1]|uniref:F-box domain-containing protein n=1 Tax=Collybiopsis luxurians FD-317 M1 TaxID=944289 RepID=A0A0D0B4B9_9AGAR|nr:hypothetical protein GYMLUDRAFT_75157 [Collybiopsis luxurians FD-317 M1]